MKITLFKTFSFILFAVAVSFAFGGCNKYTGSEMRTLEYTVDVRDWRWNPDFRRFEYAFSDNAISRDVCYYGVVNVSAYILEYGYEVLKPLPFVQSYAEGWSYAYTETISFDYSPGEIAFFIQASDLSDTREWLQTYSFKVTLIRERFE